MDEVFRIGKRITVMRDGRHVTTRTIDQVSVAELVRLMANRDLSEHFPKVRVERGAELLRVDKLSAGGRLADISFALHAGEVLGISGLLGGRHGDALPPSRRRDRARDRAAAGRP